MTYAIHALLVFFIILYIACSYLIYRFIGFKNQGIYTGLSGIKKVGIMLILPVLAIVMAAIHFLSKTPPPTKE